MKNDAAKWISQTNHRYWAMEPRALEGLMAILAGPVVPVPAPASDRSVGSDPSPLSPSGRGQGEGASTPPYQLFQGTAIIPITGYLLDEVPDFFEELGIQATSYESIIEAVQDACADEAVERIVLRVTSPGGIIDGVFEAAYAIADARTRKPVHAYIEHLGASAAYWLASQASSIVCNQTATVGSVGVYTVAVDMSAAAAAQGIKVHVIATGPLKGAGVPGSVLTPDQLAAIQENIDALGEDFILAIARGRGMEVDAVRALATGRSWHSQAALECNLVNAITPFAEFLAAVPLDPNPNTGVTAMAEKAAPAPIIDPAVLAAEIRAQEHKALDDMLAAFPAEKEFALEAFKAGKSIQAAKADYCAVLDKRIATLTDANAKLVADLKAANEKLAAGEAFKAGSGPAVPAGQAPVPTPVENDPVAAFEARVAEIRAANPKLTATQARSQAANDKGLYAAYLAAKTPRAAKG